RRGNERGDAGDPEVRLFAAAQKAIAQPSADERADESRGARDRAERRRRLDVRHPANPLQKRGHPESEAAQREGVGAVAERGEEVALVAEEVEVGVKSSVILSGAKDLRLRSLRSFAVPSAL